MLVDKVFQELDMVVLTSNLEEMGLKIGDIGTIVAKYNDHAYEVEFTTAHGETISIETLKASNIRAINDREIYNVRTHEKITA